MREPAGPDVGGRMAGRRPPAGGYAAALLARARAEYDRPGSRLPGLARAAAAGGFAGGAGWMAAALGQLRGRPVGVPPGVSFHRLGAVKYAVASAAAAVAVVSVVVVAGLPGAVAALAAVPAFYAAEVQMVFLFPVALDGGRQPFRDARRLTRRAGGTWYAGRVVVRLAAHMLFGGLAGCGGPVRAWCAGCLAVCLWYEDVRVEARPADAPAWRPRLEVGGAGDLLTRVERVRVPGRGAGAPGELALFYASDLHLGRPWTRRVAGEVLAATRRAAVAASDPTAVLLGGDLVDCGRGLGELAELVRDLAAVAPVYAVPGNHDERVGAGRVRDAVLAGGGRWLPDGGGVLLAGEVWLGWAVEDLPPAVLTVAARVLCAHDPAVFPAAAAAGFDVVLAGHLHGGQCVVADRGGRLYPGALVNRWTGLRFDAGPDGCTPNCRAPDGRGPTMLVSRGAGDTLPVRWGCPREVLVCRVVVTLRSPSAAP